MSVSICLRAFPHKDVVKKKSDFLPFFLEKSSCIGIFVLDFLSSKVQLLLQVSSGNSEHISDFIII